MKNTLKFFCSFLSALACSCGNTSRSDEHVKPRPVNFIVLLDLSDRLLTEGQTSNDKALIQTVFTQFRKAVFEKSLVIGSKDKFRIVIAPQTGITYNPASHMNHLSLDMALLPVGEKLKQFQTFENELSGKLTLLYTSAMKDKTQPFHFPGCDIWKFFDNYLKMLLVDGADNRLVILTDGYFDFEDGADVLTKGHLSTSTHFISVLKKSSDWGKTMKEGNYGLLPVKINLSSVSISVTEISPKSGNLNEEPILKAVWSEWLTGMKAKQISWIPKYSLTTSKSELLKFLDD